MASSAPASVSAAADTFSATTASMISVRWMRVSRGAFTPIRTLSPLISSSVISMSPSMRTLSPIRLVKTSIRSA